jgi:hypothetical protein
MGVIYHFHDKLAEINQNAREQSHGKIGGFANQNNQT